VYCSADRSEGSQELERLQMDPDYLSLTVTIRESSIHAYSPWESKRGCL